MANIAVTLQFETDDIENVRAHLLGRLVAYSLIMNLPMSVKFEKQDPDTMEWEDLDG